MCTGGSRAVCGLLLAAIAVWPPASDAGTPVAGPFDAPSALPFHLPAFDRIAESDYRPAFTAGMAQQLQEVDAIAHNPQAPTFENTIVALERSGQMLTRVSATFTNLTSSNTNPEHDAIDSEISPKLAAHQDAIFLNASLYQRVQTLYDRRDHLDLDAESLRVLERYRALFLRAGAALDEDAKRRLRERNVELSSLTTTFDQILLRANKDSAIVVDRRSDLAGLSDEQIDAAAFAAKERKLEGKWVLPLEKTTGQATLASLKNRALRERIFRASVGRADGGADDTRELLVRLAQRRSEKAALLGYANWAAYVLADESAGTTAAVNQMLAQLAPAAVANAREQAAQLQQLIDSRSAANHTPSFRLEPWDWSFYTEQLRKIRYDFDEAQVRPYFELEHVLREGLFYAAHELYGLTLRERTDLPVYQPDVRIFEVMDANGKPTALLLIDYFARDNKQGGGWESEYVSQSRLLGLQPVVVNNLNVPKPAPGQPALMSFDDVDGMFHEFGHALHAIFSDVQYPLFAGTNVPLDFVEYPSQFNEMWSRDPKVLAHMARHYQTGAPMPPALLEKVLAAQKFNRGFETTEYLAAAILDQAWHQLTVDQVPAADGVAQFEANALQRAGIGFYAVPPRYHSSYFSHIFGASGYSAGYYSYIWSDVLAKDTENWMNTHGGLQRANGDFLRAKVLSRGFSVDPGTLFREFYGQEPDVAPLLEYRGLRLPPANPVTH